MPRADEKSEMAGTMETLSAMDDEELDAVTGGYEVVFQDQGENRDSWFVSLMMRRMVQDSIRRALASPPYTVPETITVGSRRFRVKKLGEDFYVDEIRS